jgi:hypothetical protein
MKSKAEEGRDRKFTLPEVEDFLRQYSFCKLFNLLPPALSRKQVELVGALRQVAIVNYNHHGDADAAKGILSLCKRFRFRDTEIAALLEQDFSAIEQEIAEERKHEARLVIGADRPFEITKEGVRDRTAFFPAATVRSLRWGAFISGPVGERFNYFFAVADNAGACFTVSWGADASTKEKQSRLYGEVVTAALHYLAVLVIDHLKNRLLSGQRIEIGPCTLSRDGIGFRTEGWVVDTSRFVRWRDVATAIRDGHIIVSDSTRAEVSVAVEMSTVDNAVVLPILAAAMAEPADATDGPKLSDGGADPSGSLATGAGEANPVPSEWHDDERYHLNRGGVACFGAALLLLFIWVTHSASSTATTRTETRQSQPFTSTAAYSSQSGPGATFPGGGEGAGHGAQTPIGQAVLGTNFPGTGGGVGRDWERQLIETEKDRVGRMIREVDALAAEIQRERVFLDDTSAFEIEAFNRKVRRHNELLEQAKAQQRQLNQMIDRYNQRLEQQP